uniref:Uncharacterized protein n=1 Tax=Aegilops tauschii TaxID=37682 RepID=M8CRS2_AEGTA
MEFLDLSGNNALQVLSCLSKATSLKTLVLDGCVGLEHLGPEALPPSLESFSLDVRPRKDDSKEAKISRISLAGCVRLSDFTLCGSLPNLEGSTLEEKILTQTSYINMFWSMDTNKFSLKLCISASGQWCNKDKMGSCNCGKLLGPTQSKSLIPNQSCNDFVIDDITIDHDYNRAAQFQPSTCHVEIGEGISNTSMESTQGRKAIIFVMDRTGSLHVHDNYSINTIIPDCIMTIEDEKLGWDSLQQCRVERCPKLDRVFATNYDIICFKELQNLWAADLLMVSCVWSRGNIVSVEDTRSFVKLQSIHLYSCPRLEFVLPLSWAALGSYFPNLEIIHIVCIGN